LGAAVTVSTIDAVLVRLPDVPVTVTVTVVGVAVLLAVSVSVLVSVVLLGLNDAVTPLGRPEADRLTVPVKPFCGLTVTVLVPFPPCTTLTLAGDAPMEKLGGAFTVSATDVVLVKLPEVPVMVMLLPPSVAVLLAVSVSVLASVVGLALNDAVTPLGRPEADRLTAPVKPFCGVTVMVLVPLAP